MYISLVTLLLFLFIFIITYCDLRFNKIYNWITVPLLVAGILLNSSMAGINGFFFSILGALAGLFVLLLPYTFGWIGGGDVKFLTAAGALIGPYAVLMSTIIGLLFFGLIAIAYLVVRKNLLGFIKQLLLVICGVRLIQVSGTLPMGVFLGLGTLFYWLFLAN